MSLSNATTAIAKWASERPGAESRDTSQFLAACILVATSDGPIDDAERAQLVTLQSALTGQVFDDQQVDVQLDYVNQVGVDARIQEMAGAVTDEGERDLLVAFASLMACAERGVNAEEGTMLQKIGQGLGFSQLGVQKILGRAMNAAAHGA